MRTRTLTLVSVALVTFCSVFSRTANGAVPPLADRVPADALVFLSWSGSNSPGPGYDGSHLKAVLDASAIPEFFGTILQEVVRRVSPKDQQAAQIIQLVSDIAGPMWRHPTAFYFGGVDWNTGGPPSPRIALLCDAGAEADRMLAKWNEILKQKPADGPPIEVSLQGSLVVITIGQPGAAKALLPAQAGEALAASPKFVAALGQTHTDAITAIYLDMEGIDKAIDDSVHRIGQQQATDIWTKVRAVLALPSMRQAILTAGFDGKDWCEEAFVGTDGGKSGLLSLFVSPPLSDDALAMVPQSATRVFAGHFDLAGTVRQIREGIEQFDPSIAEQFDAGLARINLLAGVDIQHDLLDPLGDQWVLYTDRAVGGPGFLGAVIVNKLADAQHADAGWAALATRVNEMVARALRKEEITVQFREMQMDGLTVHYLAVPLVSPAWTVKDGNLYFALYPQVISAAVRAAGSHGPSIQQNPAFADAMKRMGDHKASGLSFTNLPETAPEAYSGLLAISRLYLGFADLAGVPTPPMVLPPLDKLLPHLSPSSGMSWTDETGWHSKVLCPFPGSDALADSGGAMASVGEEAMLVSILLPSLNRARETANRVKCASNERQIGQAMLLYANENHGKYPDDLGTLIKTEDITPEVFICPTSGESLPTEVRAMTKDRQADWVNEHSDYLYLGKGQTNTAPADRVMVYEKPDAHEGDGMNMLFGDGHVEFEPMLNANRLIEEQAKRGEQGL